ncbi:chorismate mutase, partial [Buchnera aphidicola]|nr:chorismate mutase [Buchnera aphidicola]
MSINDSFLKLRNNINNIDEKIIKLLAKRNACILKITQSKIKNNQKIRDKIREKELLKKVIKLGKENNLNSQYINELFQLIIKESILNQQALVQKLYNDDQFDQCCFSFLGPKGSYSHIALNQYAHRYYIKSFNKECNTFEEIIDTVNNNQAK